tara:strand:+ start:250 stop:750 length:501 start_codon:yes stop_codon:yes gene_type:complete
MAKSKPLDIDLLITLIDYNKNNGLLKWKDITGRGKKKHEPGSVHKKTGYKRLTVLGRTLSHHRVAWALHYSEQPPKIIDHIDGDKTNNKISNLRSGIESLNQQNQTNPHSRNKTSIYIGVSLFKGRWRAKIYHNKKYYFLGYFKSEVEARDAYIKEKRNLHRGCTI